MRNEITYCDDCGDIVEQSTGTSGQSPFGGEVKPYATFTEVPFNVQSANAGESAVVCLDCIEEQMREVIEGDEDKPTNEPSEPTAFERRCAEWARPYPWDYEPAINMPRPKDTHYQPTTGQKCGCRPGVERDNCPRCEGTGWVIDFARIRARREGGRS